MDLLLQKYNLEGNMAAFYRFKQFWNALFSKLSHEDIVLLKAYLNDQEQLLFSGMDRQTQTHCVRVARTTLKMLSKYSSSNEQVVIKAALLHDIGKPPNVIRTFDRVLIVLLNKFAPRLFEKLLECPRNYGHFHKAIISYKRHPELGAKLAETFNLSEEIVTLIKQHHHEESPNEPVELKILREADNLN